MIRKKDYIQKLTLFIDVTKRFSSAKTVKAIMLHLTKVIDAFFKPKNWSLLLKDRKTGELYFSLVFGTGTDKLKGLKVPQGDGIVAWIYKTGKAKIVKDVHKDPKFSRRFDKISKFKTKSIIGVPLRVNNKAIGVIELINSIKGNNFTEIDLKMLTILADLTAISIEKVYYLNSIKKMASTDPLTGVYNRRYFDNMFFKEVERCKRYKYTISMCFIDIDKFKTINDKYGHAAGDVVLKDLSAIMKRNVREADIIARYGGDEFVVLMPHTNKKNAKKLIKRISEIIKQYNKKKSTKVPFSVSIGISSSGPGRVTQLLKKSDINLYRIKFIKKREEVKNIRNYFQDAIETKK